MFRRLFSRNNQDIFDIEDESELYRTESDEKSVEQMSGCHQMLLTNPLRLLFDNREKRIQRILYKQEKINIINAVLVILIASVVYCIDSNITTLNGIIGTALIYLIYCILFNVIEGIHIKICCLLNGMILSLFYYLCCQAFLLLFINYDIIITLPFALLSCHTISRLKSYLQCFYSGSNKAKHFIILYQLYVLSLIVILVFNIGVGMKTFQRRTGIDVETIYLNNEASLGIYKTDVSGKEELDRYYEDIFKNGSTYGNINSNGDLIDRLPSTQVIEGK